MLLMGIDVPEAASVLLPILFVYFVAFYYYACYRKIKDTNDIIRARGVRAAAQIHRLQKTRLTSEVIYMYEHEGKQFAQSQPISRETLRALHEGDSVFVCYLIDHPEQAYLADIDGLYLEYRIASWLFTVMTWTIAITVIIIVLSVLLTPFFLHLKH